MKQLLLLASSLLLSSTICAQGGVSSSIGASGAAMGGSGITNTTTYAAFGNAAGLAFAERFGVAIQGERRFVSEAMNDFGLAMHYALPSSAGTLGLSVNYFGFKGYNEQKIGLSYSRKLAKTFAVAAKFDYLGLRIPEYGTRAAFTFELGGYYKPSRKVAIGLNIYSPLQVKLTENADKIPTEFRLGAAYLASENLTMTAEVVKDLIYPAQFRGGLEYKMGEVFAIRAGLRTQPFQPTFGFGLKTKNIYIDIASAWQTTLGFTPGLSMRYQL